MIGPDWIRDEPLLAASALALVAAAAALIAHAIVGAVLRRATRSRPVLHSMLQAARPASTFAWPLLALQLVWTALPDDMAYIGTIRHLNAILLIAAVTWLAMGVVSGLASGVIAAHPVSVEDNLHARRVETQARVLSRTAMTLILIAGSSMALMTFPAARQVGASLLASAGVLGIVGGLAARPVFSNLIAGLQIALAQPIRIDDVLIVNGEWGRVEEISGTYVVMKLWDERRQIVPLNWFIENPFQNWTRTSSQIHQSVYLFVDFTTPLEPLRAELLRLVNQAPDWDGRTAQLKVVDATERAMKLRILVSARAAGPAFDLGCEVREGLIAFLAREHVDALPKARQMNEQVAS